MRAAGSPATSDVTKHANGALKPFVQVFCVIAALEFILRVVFTRKTKESASCNN